MQRSPNAYDKSQLHLKVSKFLILQNTLQAASDIPKHILHWGSLHRSWALLVFEVSFIFHYKSIIDQLFLYVKTYKAVNPVFLIRFTTKITSIWHQKIIGCQFPLWKSPPTPKIFFSGYSGILQIFTIKIGVIQIFCGMPKVFPYTILIHTDFFPKILIFLVIYTDFVSDPSGRSVHYNYQIFVSKRSELLWTCYACWRGSFLLIIFPHPDHHP